MATCTESTAVQQIGEIAGAVWNTLEENGPMSFTKLTKAIDAPRDVVAFGVGWLAREDKVSIEESGRTRIISLI